MAAEKKAAVDLWTGESRRGVRVQLFARLQRPIKTCTVHTRPSRVQSMPCGSWGQGGHTCVHARSSVCVRIGVCDEDTGSSSNGGGDSPGGGPPETATVERANKQTEFALLNGGAVACCAALVRGYDSINVFTI